MNRKFWILTVTPLMLLTLTSDVFAIGRVARRFNVLEIYGGYSSPVGSYDQIGPLSFVDQQDRPVDIGADSLWDNTFHLGFTFGTLRAERLMYSIGFSYTKAELAEYARQTFDDQYALIPNFHQFDVRFNMNFHLSSLQTSPWSPYIGLGIIGGLTGYSGRGIESEYEANVAASANFGAEAKIWQAADNSSFVTVASVNSIEFLASGYRPRYLNLGAALKFYLRP
ncbi:MAG: hypothetical protein AB1644_10285 [Candidatus Zixiibacteriota bacterium]